MRCGGGEGCVKQEIKDAIGKTAPLWDSTRFVCVHGHDDRIIVYMTCVLQVNRFGQGNLSALPHLHEQTQGSHTHAFYQTTHTGTAMEARTCSTADDNSVDSAFLPDPPDGSGNYCDTDTALQAAPTARKLLPLPMPDPSSHLVSTRLRHSFKESSHSSLPADMLSTPHPHEGTARWRELGCVYIALIADAITANIIAPYAQDWVRDTYHVNNIGLYSGVLIGGVQFARALSSPFFGWISDSMGRRLLMAGGLLTAGCLTMAGGLSKNFWMCFGFRFLAGILNPCEVVATAGKLFGRANLLVERRHPCATSLRYLLFCVLLLCSGCQSQPIT